MTDIRTIIAELRELEEKATKAPWRETERTDYDADDNGEECAATISGHGWHWFAKFATRVVREDEESGQEYSTVDAEGVANHAITIASRNALPRILDYIARLEAVADAAEVVYAEWGEEEIACEFEEWRNLRSALDATDCDLKRGGE